MFAGDFCVGGVSVPSTLSLFMRCAGSCEKMHVSPARQLPDIQYLDTQISKRQKAHTETAKLTCKCDYLSRG